MEDSLRFIRWLINKWLRYLTFLPLVEEEEEKKTIYRSFKIFDLETWLINEGSLFKIKYPITLFWWALINSLSTWGGQKDTKIISLPCIPLWQTSYFTLGQKLELEFLSFHVGEEETSCGGDYLEILDGVVDPNVRRLTTRSVQN